MRAFDASSIIHAWDNYPPGQFPAVWRWLAQEIASQRIVICEVAYHEVERKFVDPFKWLKEQDIEVISMNTDMLAVAASIKSDLEIEGDKYHGKGVGENDILIVASACVEGHELITNEERQRTLPKVLAKYKIPAVCDLDSVAVPCIAFIDLIKGSGEVFGE